MMQETNGHPRSEHEARDSQQVGQPPHRTNSRKDGKTQRCS